MTPKIEFVDTRDFARGVRELMTVQKKSARQLLFEQGRLFVRDAISLTPPMGRHAFNESDRVQRIMGETATRRDVGKVFKPIEKLPILQEPQNPELALAIAIAAGIKGQSTKATQRAEQVVVFDKSTGKQRIVKTRTSRRKVLRQARGASLTNLRAILARAGLSWKVDETPDPSLHRSARNRLGRVKRARPTYILNEPARARYEREVVSHVGKTKSGWLRAADALKVNVPQWIRRHSGKVAGIFIDEAFKSKASITIGNLVDYAESFLQIRIIENALSRRTEAMRQRADHIIRGNLRAANRRR